MDGPKAANVSVVGVCVVYCQDGMLSKVWLDLDKVSAIAWTEGKIDSRGANPGHGTDKIPESNKGEPNTCPPAAIAAEETGLCWWNGSKWVCGD
jgi:hypothetical protein